MSSNGKRARRPLHYGARSEGEESVPGDEAIGAFSREQLVRFDDRFRERMERAFETGRESREAAEATYSANASRAR